MNTAKALVIAGAALIASLVLLAYTNPLGVSLATTLWLAVLSVWQYRSNGTSRGGPDLSDPLLPICIIGLISFGIRSIAVAKGLARQIPGDFSQSNVAGSTFNSNYASGAVLGTIGLGLIVLGYRVRIQSAKPATRGSRRLVSDWRAGFYVVIAAFAGGWLCRLLVLSINPGRLNAAQESTFTPTVTLAKALTTLCPVSIAISMLLFPHIPRRLARYWLGFAVTAEVLFGWAINSRSTIFGIGVMLLAWLGLSHKIILKARWLIAAPILLLGLGMTVIYRSAPSSIIGPGGRTEWTLTAARDQGITGISESALYGIIQRYHGVDSLAAILATSPMPVPRYGMSYLYGVAGPLIPRFLWPSKPNINYGEEFSVHYFGIAQQHSVPVIPTWIGDLSIQFHPAVAVLGCLMIGILLRALRERVLQTENPFQPLNAFCICSIPLLITFDGWIPLYELTLRLMAVVGLFAILHATGALESRLPSYRDSSSNARLQSRAHNSGIARAYRQPLGGPR